MGPQQDIDVFAFYQIIAKQIPNLGIAIRKILSHPAETIDNERVFNIAGHILNIRRCSLLSDRAEQLVLSAFRYRALLVEVPGPSQASVLPQVLDS